MKESIRKRIESINRGEIPEGYVSEKHQLRPSAWKYRRIGDFLEAHDEFSNDVDNYPLATSSRQGLMLQSEYYGDQRYEETSGGFHVVPEGFVTYRHMSDDDVFRFNVNNIGQPVLVSPEYPVFTTKDGLDQRLLIAYLNETKEFSAYCSTQKKGSTRTRMYFSRLCEFSMPIPPIDEQQKIAGILATCDKVIELKEHLLVEIQMLKKLYMKKLFPQKGQNIPEIRFSGFTAAWEQRKLGDMGSTFTGLSGKTKEDFGHGEAKFITYMNVFSNPMADLEMTESVEIDEKQNCVKAGDVFFTTSSETPEEVGMSSVMPINADNTYLNSFCFGYRPSEKFDLNYLAYVLRADSFRQEMKFLAQGISRYNISKNNVMDVSIPVPALEEQKKIGEYFSNLDNLITLHQRELEEWQQKKKALMQLLLTGLVRVNA